MKVLVLGGTRFIGRATVARLLAHGHEVTLNHRGQTGRDLFPEAARVLAPRAALRETLDPGARWDVVLDANGYFPAEVDAAMDALEGRVGAYVYVSSISAYADWDAPVLDETQALEPCTREQAESTSPSTYGPRKAECERRLAHRCAAAGIRLAIARPALVFGPHDYTDRLDGWLDQARRGEVRVPAGHDPLPLVYVEDVAAALDAMITRDDARGAYNLADPATPDMAGWLDALAAALGRGFARRSVPGGDVPRLTLTKPGRVRVDASRAARELGFAPTPLVGALRETARARGLLTG